MSSPRGVLAVIGMLLLALVAEELYRWSRRLANWLVERAVRLLPDADQDRYKNEWLAELDTKPNLTALVVAIGIRGFAPVLKRSLHDPPAEHPLMVACYAVLVSVGGLAVSGWFLSREGLDAVHGADGWFLLLFLLALAFDARPIRILKRVGGEGIRHSSGDLFHLALLLGWTSALAVPAITLGGLAAHLISCRHQRPLLGKALFNAAQNGLAAATAAVMIQLSSGWQGAAAQVLPVTVAAVTRAVVNTALTRTAVALDRTSGNFQALRAGWLVDLTAWIALASMAPLSFLVAEDAALFAVLIPPSIAFSLIMKRVNYLVDPGIQQN